MDSAELITLGTSMFGKSWRVDVSRNLGVSTVTVHKWVHKGKIPDTRAEEIWHLFSQRLKRMQAVAQENNIPL